MKAVETSLVSQLSGSLGSTTFVHGGRWVVLKNHPTWTKPRSGRQVMDQNRFAQGVRAWKLLSGAERAAWAAAAQGEFERSGSGESSEVTGYAYFMRCFVGDMKASEEWHRLPPHGGAARAFVGLSMAIVYSPFSFLVTFEPTPLEAWECFGFRVGVLRSATSRDCANWGLIQAVLGGGLTSPLDLSIMGEAFGYLMRAAQGVGMKAFIYDTAKRTNGLAHFASCVVQG